LVDQETSSGVIAQNIPWFSEFLVTYAKLWGAFLNTDMSFNETILESFIKFSPDYRVQDSMINGKPNAPWNCFNDFFSRKLNPGLRPIDSPDKNSVVTMPADCTFRKRYHIDADSNVTDKDSNISKITLKQTHTFGNINQLLEGSKYADSFANGTFVHYFLGPYSYHRFHAPVSGIVEECYPVQGLTFLEVNIDDRGQFDAPDNAENGYEFRQARGILTIDTTNSSEGDMGVVAVIPVGMCQVSSVHMTAPEGHINKGDEFGYFLFGGSDIIVLFQEGKSPVIDECTNYRHYGMSMSICPPPLK
jgi:phosphatidylserine decarboxylase precursor